MDDPCNNWTIELCKWVEVILLQIPAPARKIMRLSKNDYEISLRKWICAASDFIVLILFRSVHQYQQMFLELNSKDCIKVQEKKESRYLVFLTSANHWNRALSHRSHVVTADKCTKKHDAHDNLLLNLLLSKYGT